MRDSSADTRHDVLNAYTLRTAAGCLVGASRTTAGHTERLMFGRAGNWPAVKYVGQNGYPLYMALRIVGDHVRVTLKQGTRRAICTFDCTRASILRHESGATPITATMITTNTEVDFRSETLVREIPRAEMSAVVDQAFRSLELSEGTQRLAAGFDPLVSELVRQARRRSQIRSAQLAQLVTPLPLRLAAVQPAFSGFAPFNPDIPGLPSRLSIRDAEHSAAKGAIWGIAGVVGAVIAATTPLGILELLLIFFLGFDASAWGDVIDDWFSSGEPQPSDLPDSLDALIAMALAGGDISPDDDTDGDPVVDDTDGFSDGSSDDTAAAPSGDA